MAISERGITLIKHFETLHDGDLSKIGLQPKMCPAGIWTVGYGRALLGKDGKFLQGEKDRAEAYRQYPNLTEVQAEQLLFEDTIHYGGMVKRVCLEHKVTLKQHEFDALVSFAYNCGIGAIYNFREKREMAVLKALKKGEGVPEALNFWCRGGGKVLPGLVRRRKSEGHLFVTGKLNFFQK
jgi:lysozyme